MTTLGVPAETKDGERRVALDPAAVGMAARAGATVLVQSGAGTGAGFADSDYVKAGAQIVGSAADAWGASLVVKVKEPLPQEFAYFREDLRLFCYLHLAAEPGLARALVEAGVDAFAFETVRDASGLPLLAPMSEIAGRTAAIVAAHHLSERSGGSGTLVGGAAGVPAARAVVVGLGVAGTMAARGLRGLDAEVTGVDIDLDRLRRHHLDGTVTSTLASSEDAIGEAIATADVVIGAALVPGARAPRVVSTAHVASMRPGSVVVDLAIDQGGCIATSHPTSHSDPVFVDHGVVHYCVTNVPGQYPRTASRALSAAIAPRVVRLLADPEHPSLEGGRNVSAGEVVHPEVAAALGTAA